MPQINDVSWLTLSSFFLLVVLMVSFKTFPFIVKLITSTTGSLTKFTLESIL